MSAIEWVCMLTVGTDRLRFYGWLAWQKTNDDDDIEALQYLSINIPIIWSYLVQNAFYSMSYSNEYFFIRRINKLTGIETIVQL